MLTRRLYLIGGRGLYIYRSENFIPPSPPKIILLHPPLLRYAVIYSSRTYGTAAFLILFCLFWKYSTEYFTYILTSVFACLLFLIFISLPPPPPPPTGNGRYSSAKQVGPISEDEKHLSGVDPRDNVIVPGRSWMVRSCPGWARPARPHSSQTCSPPQTGPAAGSSQTPVQKNCYYNITESLPTLTRILWYRLEDKIRKNQWIHFPFKYQYYFAKRSPRQLQIWALQHQPSWGAT